MHKYALIKDPDGTKSEDFSPSLEQSWLMLQFTNEEPKRTEKTESFNNKNT